MFKLSNKKWRVRIKFISKVWMDRDKLMILDVDFLEFKVKNFEQIKKVLNNSGLIIQKKEGG